MRSKKRKRILNALRSHIQPWIGRLAEVGDVFRGRRYICAVVRRSDGNTYYTVEDRQEQETFQVTRNKDEGTWDVIRGENLDSIRKRLEERERYGG